MQGAVQPELYEKYRHFGREEISKADNTINIPCAFLCFSRNIYQVYGKYSDYELEYLNHHEGPWILARGNLNPWEESDNIITEDSMRNYYRKIS